ncbi:MAG: hypothetical protein HQK65_22710, partial [Desulfamplus sp.]|nr:hypothetical protein [Desulfamplus sp.]
YIADTESGTHVFTVDIWDNSYPSKHGQQTFTFTICEDGDCADLEYREDYAPSFINSTGNFYIPALYLRDTIDSTETMLVAEDLKMVLVPDPVGDRLLFKIDPAKLDNKDLDGDGYTSDGSGDSHPGEIDCNDKNFYINPGAKEIYGNGIDEDCFPTDID